MVLYENLRSIYYKTEKAEADPIIFHIVCQYTALIQVLVVQWCSPENKTICRMVLFPGLLKGAQARKKCSLAHLRKKLLSDILLIWQICSAMSANDLINFWEQTISKWPFSGHFEFCNTYLTQDMQNDWTMNIKQNVMSHTRRTHDKFYTKKSKVAARGHFYFFFLSKK